MLCHFFCPFLMWLSTTRCNFSMLTLCHGFVTFPAWVSMYKSQDASLQSSDLILDGGCPPNSSNIAEGIANWTAKHQKLIGMVFVWFALSSILVFMFLLTWYYRNHWLDTIETNHMNVPMMELLCLLHCVCRHSSFTESARKRNRTTWMAHGLLPLWGGRSWQTHGFVWK